MTPEELYIKQLKMLIQVMDENKGLKKQIKHLKEQLLRVGNQEKVVKEAYLAGQMAAAKEKNGG
jgi:uncharacterized protein (DUF2062 family)